jgi:hypothetical protein
MGLIKIGTVRSYSVIVAGPACSETKRDTGWVVISEEYVLAKGQRNRASGSRDTVKTKRFAIK